MNSVDCMCVESNNLIQQCDTVQTITDGQQSTPCQMCMALCANFVLREKVHCIRCDRRSARRVCQNSAKSAQAPTRYQSNNLQIQSGELFS